MKKIIATLLILTLSLFAMVGCGEEPTDDTVIRVGYIKGPTGMGMAKLINDNKDGTKYQFSFYETPAAAKDAFLDGQIDIACLSTDVAAGTLKVEPTTCALAINTLSALFLVTDPETNITAFDKENLNGKKIYTIAQGTPLEVVKAMVEAYGIDAEVVTELNGTILNSPDNLKDAIVAGSVSIAVIPEPALSGAFIGRANSGKDAYRVVANMADVWDVKAETPMAMGCIVARSSFIDEHKALVDAFMAEYKASIEFVANFENIDSATEYIVNANILPNAKLAKSALVNLGDSIAYIDGADMKNTLSVFYTAIKVSTPSDEFFYEK